MVYLSLLPANDVKNVNLKVYYFTNVCGSSPPSTLFVRFKKYIWIFQIERRLLDRLVHSIRPILVSDDLMTN